MPFGAVNFRGLPMISSDLCYKLEGRVKVWKRRGFGRPAKVKDKTRKIPQVFILGGKTIVVHPFIFARIEKLKSFSDFTF